jgi:hypothetical protein
MSIYSDPPAWRLFKFDKPTLLVCWWITIFCTVVIILRVIGRFIRTERLFTEDRIAALALVPLFLRIGCVQYILRHGTNNVRLEDLDLSASELRGREIASGLVLASRIFYAATYVSTLNLLPVHQWVDPMCHASCIPGINLFLNASSCTFASRLAALIITFGSCG